MDVGAGGGRRRRATCLLVALATVACGGSDQPESVEPGEGGSSVDDTAVTVDSTSTNVSGTTVPAGSTGGPVVIETIPGAKADEVSAVTERIQVGETVNYAGFEIEVLEVLVGFDPSGFRFAEADLALTNRTPAAANLDTFMEVVSAGVVAPLFRDGTPEVEPGATLRGTVGFRLGDDFDSAEAMLVIGRADLNRAQVPLGTTGELVALRPVDLGVTASAGDDTSSVTVTSMVLSWDSVDVRDQSSPGEVFVRIVYSLDSAVATALNDDVVRLRLPSGEGVAPRAESTQRIDPDAVADGLFASFLLSGAAALDLASGVVPPGFVLVYTERFGKGVVEVPLGAG